MRGIGEKLDQKLAQDTHDYCQKPETEICSECDGTGVGSLENGADEYCDVCNGTGQIPKIPFVIEEE